MTSYEGKTRRLEPPCHVCGGTTFIWGKTAGQNYNRFVPDSISDASVLGKIFPKTYVIRVRMCTGCHGLQEFVIVPEEER